MLYETLGFDINYVKLVDSASFQCFTGVSNHMHLTKLAFLGWMITLWITPWLDQGVLPIRWKEAKYI